MTGTATARQISFLEDLCFNRIDWDRLPAGSLPQDIFVKTLRNHHDPEEADISKETASKFIDELCRFPMKPRTHAKASNGTAAPASSPYPEVPKGRYGIVIPSMPVTFRFFRVTRAGAQKQWTNLAEVKDVTGSGRPRHIAIKNGPEKRRILELILAGGLTEGMALYGKHLGHCGRCGFTLTDDYSRLAGLGPHCRHLLNVPVDPALQARAKALHTATPVA